MLKRPHSIRAFTLLEMSVVLAIVAIVVGGGLMALTSSAQSTQYNATIATMKMIDDAMLKFRIANNRLPCPAGLNVASSATNFGTELWYSGVCDAETTSGTNMNFATTTGAGYTIYGNNVYSDAQNSGLAFTEGAVPFLALGLPPSAMYDGWGNEIRYAVSNTMTQINAFLIYPVNSACPSIEVCDSNGSTSNSGWPYCTDVPRTTSAIYALISHGANGHGAYQPNTGLMKNAGSTNVDELTNCHCTSNAATNGYTPTYVEKLPTEATAGSTLTTFDDIVTFKERWQLRTPSDLPQNILYVPDAPSGFTGNGLQTFNKAGVFLCRIDDGLADGIIWWNPSGGNGNELFSRPTVVKVDNSNRLWVIDSTPNNIRIKTASGQYIPSYANSGAAVSGSLDTKFIPPAGTPEDIAFDSVGNIWVASNNGKIYGYANVATQLTTTAQCTTSYTNADANPIYNCTTSAPPLSTAGTSPSSLAIDSNNNMWVVTTASSKNQIEGFTYAGTKIGPILNSKTVNSAQAGSTCTTTAFTTLGQITVDSNNNLWVADVTNHAIIEFNSAGTCLQVLPLYGYSTAGSGCNGCVYSGATTPGSPYGLAIDSNSLIWFSDPNNYRVQQADFCYGCGITTATQGSSTSSSSQIWIQTLGSGAPSSANTCTACSVTATTCTCSAASSYTTQYFASPAFLGMAPAAR